MHRRTALKNLSSIAAAATVPGILQAQDSLSVKNRDPKKGLRKIATEEAFVIPEIAKAYKALVQKGGTNLDLMLMKQIYDVAVTEATPSATNNIEVSNRDKVAQGMLPKLLDFDSIRLANMDANNVTMHLLSLTCPGVQVFEKDQAVELAKLANDRLTEVVKRHPGRFAGLACFAPQDANAAAKEMERSINTLNLNGFIVNSHTNNLYLDDPRFFPILEAAEALDAPLWYGLALSGLWY